MKRKPQNLYQAPSTSVIGGRRLTNAQALGLSHSLGRRTMQFLRLVSTTAPRIPPTDPIREVLTQEQKYDLILWKLWDAKILKQALVSTTAPPAVVSK